jgi:hypothetical protein
VREIERETTILYDFVGRESEKKKTWYDYDIPESLKLIRKPLGTSWS